MKLLALRGSADSKTPAGTRAAAPKWHVVGDTQQCLAPEGSFGTLTRPQARTGLRAAEPTFHRGLGLREAWQHERLFPSEHRSQAGSAPVPNSPHPSAGPGGFQPRATPSHLPTEGDVPHAEVFSRSTVASRGSPAGDEFCQI